MSLAHGKPLGVHEIQSRSIVCEYSFLPTLHRFPRCCFGSRAEGATAHGKMISTQVVHNASRQVTEVPLARPRPPICHQIVNKTSAVFYLICLNALLPEACPLLPEIEVLLSYASDVETRSPKVRSHNKEEFEALVAYACKRRCRLQNPCFQCSRLRKPQRH